MNARLAARLTGWRIDIKSESTFALEESQSEFGAGGEGALVRCAALLRNGKRCVNAALPGTRYCSLPAHARLAEMEAAGQVVGPDEAVSLEADTGADVSASAPSEDEAVETATIETPAADTSDDPTPSDAAEGADGADDPTVVVETDESVAEEAAPSDTDDETTTQEDAQ
jgi:N utilization substance protein A